MVRQTCSNLLSRSRAALCKPVHQIRQIERRFSIASAEGGADCGKQFRIRFPFDFRTVCFQVAGWGSGDGKVID